MIMHWRLGVFKNSRVYILCASASVKIIYTYNIYSARRCVLAYVSARVETLATIPASARNVYDVMCTAHCNVVDENESDPVCVCISYAITI